MKRGIGSATCRYFTGTFQRYWKTSNYSKLILQLCLTSANVCRVGPGQVCKHTKLTQNLLFKYSTMANVIKCLIMLTLKTLMANVLFIDIVRENSMFQTKEMHTLYLILHCFLASNMVY